MWGTLSQLVAALLAVCITALGRRCRSAHPARPDSLACAETTPHLGPLIATALVVVCIAGCSNDTTHPASEEGDSSDPVAPQRQPQSTDEAFRWPVDPGDPILRLDIDLPDQKEGVIQIELMRTLAPECVARIVELVDQAYYDGTTFHRVIPDFIIQGGDPKSRDQNPANDGRGGADTGLPDETSDAPFDRGVVALANHGRVESNSSQLFIMVTDHPELKGRYTVLGRISSGLDVVDLIASTPTDRVGRWGPKDRPIQNVVIRRATIVYETDLTPRAATNSQLTTPPGSPG